MTDEIGEQEGCIELIQCVPATEKEQKDPNYIPKLKINERAQEIITEKFQSPISIIAFVGKVGVGKSKLATITVETLRKTPSNPPFRPFRSGKDGKRVTQGLWMWSEPLHHPDENQQGSILMLDCEGMGELNEQMGNNLYLFCMLMSTAFAVVLRTVRVDRFLYEDLYSALRRFKDMRTPYILPNLWLVAMDTPVFCRTDPNQGDIQISKEEWIKNLFTHTSNTLSQHENQSIQSRYDFITDFLPKIDAVNIDDLPKALKDNNQQLDIFNILRNESSKEFYSSLQIAIQQILSNGGKKLPGCQNSPLFIQPGELTALMSDLIDVLNENKMPNADILINRYLLTRFMNEIVNEQVAQFENELLEYAQNILGDTLNQRKTPESPGATIITDEQMNAERDRLTKKNLCLMIRLARYQIYGLDIKLADEYIDNDEQEKALSQLPKIVQEQFKTIRMQMDGYHEPEFVIKQIRENLVIKDLIRQQQEQRQLLRDTMKKVENKRDLVHREKRINNSLKLEWAKPVRIGLAPCKYCEREGGAINYTHWKRRCPSRQTSNYYYYNREDDRMVCAGCRQVVQIHPEHVECRTCGKPRKVTRFFKYNE